MKEKIKSAFTLGKDLWDPSQRFETSWFLPPWALFAFRALFVSLFNILDRSAPCKMASVSRWTRSTHVTMVKAFAVRSAKQTAI